MLQNQYYNSKLTKDHIEKILANYNIKYNTMKNEIDAKFNSMIKLFINDIKAFLQNIEEISKERKKIKEAENNEMELAILKNKLEEKNKTEHQLQYELELLTKENEELKKKIKFKDQILRNKNINSELTNNNLRLKTESTTLKNKYKKYTTGNKTERKEKPKNINVSIDVKTEVKRPKKNKIAHKSNKSSTHLDKNINTEDIKYANVYIKSKKRLNNSMDKRSLKKKTNLKKSTLSTEKSPEIKSNQETKSSSNVQNVKNMNILNDEKLNAVEAPFSDRSYLENESITTDEILDEEIKELEIQEENIILLMDKIKQLNGNI